MSRAKDLFIDYGWIGLVLLVTVGALWQIGLFDSDQPRAAAAPDDTYVEFYPGEVVELDPEYNASCLNQHLPFSVVARWKHDTHVERVNVTHKVRKWAADLVLKRGDRQHGTEPSQVRVHERTIEACHGEPDTTVEGKEYIRSVVPHTHRPDGENCIGGEKLGMSEKVKACTDAAYALSVTNGTFTTTCTTTDGCGPVPLTFYFKADSRTEAVKYWHNTSVEVQTGWGQ